MICQMSNRRSNFDNNVQEKETRLMKMENINNLFIEGLVENNTEKLLLVPKSDLHNHSTKGCRREWIEEKIGRSITKQPERFAGLDGMQEWFTTCIKPYCSGSEGIILRWEGAFAEAKRNNIARLSMNFGAQEIDLVGGIEKFESLIEGFRKVYCPDIIFEPEITYVSRCDAKYEAAKLEQYVSTGYFKSIDVCGGENFQPFEAFIPLYREAEKYHLTKIMHVGETGTADDIYRAIETLGLTEIHHGINAVYSDDVLRFLADNHIQLNVCPSSNVMLGFAKDYSTHPIKILYENGIIVTINTDDLLIFDSSIENEYLMLYKSGALDAMQLNCIREQGLNGIRQ